MKFTVERKALVKMLQCVGKKHPTQTRRDKQVRLYACAARVFVDANHTTAGTEALVFEDGTCFLQQSVFLKVLKTYTTKPNVTIEAGGSSLKFFSTTLPITDFSRTAIPPGKFRVFPVTDLTVLRPQGAPPPPSLAPASPPAPEPEPPPAVSHEPGTFPVVEDETYLVKKLAGLTRRLCALPKIQPEQLAGLAHALFALERLPRITQGVDVEFTLGVPSETKESYPLMLHISDASLAIGVSFSPGGPPQIDYEVKSDGYRSIQPGDQFASTLASDWPDGLESLLDENSPDLQLSVTDTSTPGFMSHPSNKQNPPPPRPRR